MKWEIEFYRCRPTVKVAHLSSGNMTEPIKDKDRVITQREGLATRDAALSFIQLGTGSD